MVAKTNAQRCKEYRERQKAKKIIQLQVENRLQRRKRKTGDVHHLPDTEKLGSQIEYQASQLKQQKDEGKTHDAMQKQNTSKLEALNCQSGLQASNECPEVLQRNSFQAPYEQHTNCAQPEAIYYHDTEILSDGNCFFFSVIKIMNLALSPSQIRQQLLASSFINSCINPNGARSILESETDYAEMDCIEIFARVYNQNVCVHNHYVNTKTGTEERQFLHFKINDSEAFLHLHLCNMHFTPLIETTAMIVNTRLNEENDVDDNHTSDDVNDATPYMDINNTNIRIPIYTSYHKHASAHLIFYNIFKSNTFGHSCAVCDRLCWKKDLKNSIDLHDNILQMILQNYVCGNAVELCGSCMRTLVRGKIPRLAVYNGFSFPEMPPYLPKLNLIEQRLISPRIPFMQIRRFRHLHDQYGINGQIVNVLVEVNTMVNQLPRNIDDDDCFYAQIKKKPIEKTSYVHELINKGHIMQWLLYLVNTPLYVRENITINEAFFNSYGVDTEHSVHDISEHSLMEDKLIAQQQTLMWNEDKMLQVAPGKKSIPNSILFNECAEELSFPTIYGGQFRTYRDGCNVTSFMQVSSELRRTDRRAADPQHLLYVAAKIMRQLVSTSVGVALKHVEIDTKITKEDVQSEDFIRSFIETNLAFLHCIPNSAWHWMVRKNDIFAMIRQLGVPTASMTLSANETGWPDLLKLLYKLKNYGAEIEDELLSEMSYVQKAQLVNEDAVTCVIYFDKLVMCLLKILQTKKGNPFGKYRVKDYFKRIEFQHRGSPRAHILLWLDNAPEDLPNNSESFTDMVDTLVSVSKSEASGNIKLQNHKHTFTCYKEMDSNKKYNCRHGAPFLPSRNTIILMPMKDTDSDYCVEKIKEYNEHYALLKTNLKNNNYNDIDHFYAENNIVSDKHYYDIIRAGIVRPTLLYRRTPSEKWHNTFNPFVFHYLKSTMDIQIIHDEYTCAAYVVEYVNKHSRAISNLQQFIIQIMDENPAFDIVHIIKKLSIDVLHSVEIPVQEAAWYLLREPMTKSSVVSVYIPTMCPTERQKIKNLSDLDDDCTNTANWFDMYEERPDNLEDTTLAQFVAYYNKTYGEYYQRTISRVIKYRNYDMAKKFNDYRREMVLLHIPFRSENNDVLAENKFIQIYEDNKDLILERRKEFESNLDIDKILEICRQLGREDDEDKQLRNEMNVIFETDAYGRLLQDVDSAVSADIQDATLSEHSSVAIKKENLMSSTEQFYDLMRSTDSEPNDQLIHIMSHLQNLNEQPFQIFFTGSSGSGKTFLIKLIMDIYNRFSDTDGYCNAYVACASTAKADVANDGNTIHTALKISISKLLPLSFEISHLYRSLFKYVKVLIIDEISIVGAGLLEKIDLRLKQITGSYKTDFGGIDVILIDDIRQEPPVKATSMKTRMVGPHIWRSLKFFQLTHVMRHANAAFPSILTKIRNGDVIEDFEFELIDSRFFKIEDGQQLFPHSDAISSHASCDTGENKLGVDIKIEPLSPDFVSVTIKAEPNSDHESVDEFATVKSKCYKDYEEVNNTEEPFVSNNKAKCDQESASNTNMGRHTKNAARMRKRYSEESNSEKEKRLEANRKRMRLIRSQESLQEREERLARMRSYSNNRSSRDVKHNSELQYGLFDESVRGDTKSFNVMNCDNGENKLDFHVEIEPPSPDFLPVTVKAEPNSDHESDAKSLNVNCVNGENKLGVDDETEPPSPDFVPVTIKVEPNDL